uniref:PWI domain-containing protein n=1 Tax=Ciona savignyi TaxID=51511 RepID=H2ZHU5_CIOSA
VFVGNISDRASDALIRQILMKCGSVFTWKRVQGASGKLQAFGFCEYRDPESALRAICILHDFQLGDKKLLVKVDAKTQDLIDEWKKRKGIEENNEDGSPIEPSGVEEARSAIEVLHIEYAGELNTPKLESEKLDTLQQHKREHPTKNNKKDKSNKDTEKRHKDREHERASRDRNRERSQRNESPPRRQVHRTRSRSPRRQATSRNSSPPRRRRTRSPPPRRSPPRRIQRQSRSPPPRRRSPSPVPRRRVDAENDEDYELHEQRRLERKNREKEAAYQARLHAFETRERRKKRDLEKRDEKEVQQRKELIREAKRLREFLDYDDDRSDGKYYTGSALTKRQRDYEREQEADERDRKKEQEEIDALRKRLVEEHHPDPDSAISKVLRETENIWEPLLQPDTPPPKNLEEMPKSLKNSKEILTQQRMTVSLSSVKSEELTDPASVPMSKTSGFVQVKEEETKIDQSSRSSTAPQPSIPQALINPAPKVEEPMRKPSPVPQIITTATNKRKKLTVKAVNSAKHAEEDKKVDEQKRKKIRALIERIPTKKDDLFDYTLDWSMVDSTLMEKRIQPWITKKIMEYIGEEEPTLVEFICSKIMTKSNPDKILEDISMVLDDEAEVFVVKMWRLLIYETEAKKEGLT